MKLVYIAIIFFTSLLAGIEAFTMKNPFHLNLKASNSHSKALQMAHYSSDVGVPMALVEERDACGVGFIASLDSKPSHSIIQQALAACTCMEHRGATSSDNVSGDGAGVMTAIPWKLYRDIIADEKSVLNKDGSIASAVGMIFLPKNEEFRAEVVEMVTTIFEKSDFKVLGWRDVPVDKSFLGELSAEFVPHIKQIVVQSTEKTIGVDSKDFNKKLYKIRREIQGNFRKLQSEESYVCSLSSKTLIYKGMLMSCDLGRFYKDLQNPDYESVFAIYHRRFSTNTVPKWFLAQPMRLLAHNGEINTLLGNINWVKSRQYAARRNNKQLGDKSLDRDYIGPRKVKGPLVDVGRSDSANLDSILESYVRAGFTAEEALMILVPEAYTSQPKLKDVPEVQAFYTYYESIQEAWDGPALLVFSDGDVVGATLDRNGLRPARYMVTGKGDDKFVHMMSEVGVTKALEQFNDKEPAMIDGMELINSGRIGPGQMLSVHLDEGKLYLNDQLKKEVASSKPYGEWVEKVIFNIPRKPFTKEIETFVQTYGGINVDGTGPITDDVDNKELITMQSFFGWGTEDVEIQLTAMAKTGVEATYSMGDDAPLAALSVMPHSLFDYFKQRFAQVTNPAIDPLREGAVMSLSMFLGARGDPTNKNGPTAGEVRVKIESPVMNKEELQDVAATDGITMNSISTLYPLKDALSVGGLQNQIDKICAEAIELVKSGSNVINLSDESSNGVVDKSMTYIPPLLAVGSIHHALINNGLRTNTSIVITTGQAWSTHHFACLVGFGASAVIPYGAYNAVINWHSVKRNQLAMERGDFAKISAEQAIQNFRKGVDKGLLKILSKMGISLLTSYHGAQIFECLGLADEVLEKSFRGTPCRVPGLTYDEIAAETADFSRRTFGDNYFKNMLEVVEGKNDEGSVETLKPSKLFNYGFLNYFKSGDYHHNNQPLVKTLHSAIRTNDLDLYNLYEQSIRSRPPTTFRDTLQFSDPVKEGREPIPLDQVESAENIMKRFVTGGMSLGALSREAHETLAIAMNRIGGKSNSGEGGEDFQRSTPIDDVDTEGKSLKFPHLKGLEKGDLPKSKIKQVASGRFGVTPQYLMSGDQLEIKVAQGAKPGEGGQLPGAKIDEYIASLRASKPGVTLISPPPHHDIYSIEDLAQLIYDLHQINPKAGVSVKLVSEVGIGTVASGVAKAGADIIQVAGHDGGTGASPASSIKYAGSPWELGLVETHATLMQNGLRDRVLLRVDGGLKSGWDVVMAAAMGAEEFGFGTIALIAEGCIMARVCHTNKCPVGVTTQNVELRKRFPGSPENVVTFFGYVAEEVRHILAELGFKSLDELIGLPGVLEPRKNLELKKTKGFDVSHLLDSLICYPKRGENFCDLEDDRSWLNHGDVHSNGRTFDDIILEDSGIKKSIDDGVSTIAKSYHITNTDRSAFARVSGAIAKKYGDRGFQGRLQFALEGGAGQSFCAFLGQGMEINLRGYANDYVCKGMAGGEVVISPPNKDLANAKSSNPKEIFGGVDAENKAEFSQFNVVGNTCLYGATGGSLFVRGRGGERFAVRNSGALGVVEGLGDHGCEYMTAGTVVNLGSIGRNFGAGMTGGLAFLVTDEEWLDTDYFGKHFPKPTETKLNDFINTETCGMQTLDSSNKAAVKFLTDTLEAHVERTSSHRAAFLLANLEEAIESGRINIIVPNSEKSNPLLAKADVSAVSAIAVL